MVLVLKWLGNASQDCEMRKSKATLSEMIAL